MLHIVELKKDYQETYQGIYTDIFLEIYEERKIAYEVNNGIVKYIILEGIEKK